MRYAVHLLNDDTDERVEFIATLSRDESKSVSSLKRRDPKQANLIGQCFALKQAYSKYSARSWCHVEPPEPIGIN
jgi:hypothetical protein